jgi:hypothetical protein
MRGFFAPYEGIILVRFLGYNLSRNGTPANFVFEPLTRLELVTCALRMRRSTN